MAARDPRPSAVSTWARASTLLALVPLLLVVASVPALAQTRPLDEARAADRDGDIERARRAYERVLDEGRATTDELVETHARLGVLTAAMGETERARAHFRIALALSPELPAPRDLAPAELQALESLRRERSGRALRATLVAPRTHERGTELSLAIEARDAGGAGVARMRLRVEPSGFERTMDGVGPATIVVPESALADTATITARLALLDVHGAVLASSSADIAVGDHPASTPTERPPQRADGRRAPARGPFAAPGRPRDERRGERSRGGGSLWSSPWLWLTVGVVLAGGVTAGVIAATGSDAIDVGAPVID